MNSAEPFDACWQRIDRAETHRKAAADAWNAWLENEPYFVTVDCQTRITACAMHRAAPHVAPTMVWGI